MNFKRYIFSKEVIIGWAVDILMSIILILISLRYFLFSGGMYSYSDQNWPMSTALMPSGIFSFGISYFGIDNGLTTITRDIVTWPYPVFRLFSPNIEVLERVFVFYTFFLYFFLLLILARLLWLILTKLNSLKLSFVDKRFFVFFVALIGFANFEAMNLNADGGTFSDGLIAILIGISILLIIGYDRRNSILVNGVLLGVTALLDPDYFLFFALSTAIVSLIIGISERKISIRILGWLYSLFISLPVIIFLFYFSSVISAPGNSIANYRPLSEAVIGSMNLHPLYAIALLGHLWATMTFAPPNILLYQSRISSLSTLLNPAQILLPPGVTTFFWMVCIYSIPFFSFISLIFKQSRRIVVPLVTVAIASLFLMQYVHFRFIYNVLLFLSNIPGSPIGTIFAFPGHLLILLEVVYVLLIPVTFFNILFYLKIKEQKQMSISIIHTDKQYANVRLNLHKFHSFKSVHKSKIINRFIIIISFFMVFAVIFSGWQAFDGSFYPSRVLPPYVGGNNVPNNGAYTPFIPSNYTLQIYDTVEANPALNVYWPQGYWPTLRGESSCWLSSGPQIPYLMKNSLLGDIVPYLQSLSIKYVVLQESKDITTYQIENTWGVPTFSQALNLLNNTPGLLLTKALPDIYMYTVSNVSSLITTNSIALNFNGTSCAAIPIYSIFDSLSYPPVITYKGVGVPLSLNSLNGKINVLGPSYLSNLSDFYPICKSTNNLGNYDWYQNNSLGQYVYSVGNFSVLNWAGNFSGKFSDGAFTFASNGKTELSLELNLNNILSNVFSLKSVNQEYLIKVTIGGVVLNGTSLSSHVILLEDNKTGVQICGEALDANITKKYHTSSYILVAPASKDNIGVRITEYFKGAIQLRDIVVSVQGLSKGSEYPFGNLIRPVNKSFSVTLPKSSMFVLATGKGIVNNILFSPGDFLKWLSLGTTTKINAVGNLSIASVVMIENSSLKNLSTMSITYNVAMAGNYEIITPSKLYKSIESIEGTNIFYNVTSNNTRLIVKGSFTIPILYLVIVLYMSTIILFVVLDPIFIRKSRS